MQEAVKEMSLSTIARTGTHSGTHAHNAGGRSLKRFFGHFGEMAVAMMLGMAVGGMLGIARVGNPELKAALWLVAMTAPMVAWMRYRGMSWRQSAEMSVAMALPTLAALPAFWGGLITPRALNSIEHSAMLPAMFALMVFRRREYGW